MKKDKVTRALKHKDIFRAGEKLRRKLHLSPKQKFKAIMKEFNRGTLYSGSGKKVAYRKQAIAIAYSEAGRRKR